MSGYCEQALSISVPVTGGLPTSLDGFGGSVGGSVGGGNSKVKSDYRSVTEQSAIRAGNKGFDVAVAGDTDLRGGAITSTQQAIDDAKNRFETGGGLSLTDIHNEAGFEGKASGVSLGFGASPSGELTPQGTSAGIGKVQGQAESMTLAAISGIAGDTQARTGDPGSGLAVIFDPQRVGDEIDAQVRITQTFGRLASKAVGDFAQTKMNEARALRAQAEREADASRANALKAEAEALESQWGANGTLRLAAHTLIGGLTGGAEGALGTAVGTLTAPAVAEALAKAGIGGALATAITGAASTAVGAAVGAAVGGTAGGSTALNEVANNYLSHIEASKLVDARKRQRQCTDATCWREAQEVIDRYTNLSVLRDDALRTACAQDSAGSVCQFHIALANEAAQSYQGQGVSRYSELGEYAAQASRMTDTPHYQPEMLKLLAARIGMPVAMMAVGTAAVTASQILAYCATNPYACNVAGIEIANIAGGDALTISLGAALAGKAVTQVTNTIANSTTVAFDAAQLQSKFKHAADFGVAGGWGKNAGLEFENALKLHLDSPTTQVIQGTYRGEPVTHFFDPQTGLNVVRDAGGNFLSGWKLSPAQIKNVTTTGKLGGG